MPRKPELAALIAAACALAAPLAAQSGATSGAAERLGLGQTPSEELLRAWNIDIAPDGANLPADASGTVAEGEAIYEASCRSCHGAEGRDSTYDQLAGGDGSLDTDSPVRTVGSYWPHATTLYDYIHRAMPFHSPQSLSPHEVYAVTAYVLHLNDILPEDARLDAGSLPGIDMPNRDAFRQTDTVLRADTVACMTGCPAFDTGPAAAEGGD